MKSSKREASVVTLSDDRARLRAAIDELQAAGVVGVDKLARLGAAEMIERCLAAWRVRGQGDPARLAGMVRQGGPDDADNGYVSQRRRVLGEMNAWRRGYPEAS